MLVKYVTLGLGIYNEDLSGDEVFEILTGEDSQDNVSAIICSFIKLT
jgi:hypothetical protein